MQPLISVCIPVFNGEKYLRQCLDSIISQTFKEIEIIILDDCSTDNSWSLIEEYKKKDIRIKTQQNPSNIGLVKNWNQCIQYASGEWIKFVFQDDYLEPNCIEMFAGFMKESRDKVPLLVSKRKFLLSELSNEKDEQYYSKKLPTLDRIKSNKNKILAKDISNAAVANMSMNFIGEPTVIMFKKEITEEVGYFNQSLKQLCDLEFALRIASRYGLIYIPHELTHFRVHKDSMTSRNAAEKYYEMSYLEPVRLAHELLFSKEYLSLRNNLSLFHKIKLKVYFYVRGYEAYIKAKMNVADMALFDSGYERYPMMKTLKKESLMRRVLYGLVLLRRNISS